MRAICNGFVEVMIMRRIRIHKDIAEKMCDSSSALSEQKNARIQESVASAAQVHDNEAFGNGACRFFGDVSERNPPCSESVADDAMCNAET